MTIKCDQKGEDETAVATKFDVEKCNNNAEDTFLYCKQAQKETFFYFVYLSGGDKNVGDCFSCTVFPL